MMETNYFLGIDLGTTNSVIAYANPQANGELKPTVLEIPRLSDTGGSRNEKTLPSVVYYKQDRNGKYEAIVGDFAKAQYGKRYGFIIKSIKSSMGKDEIPDVNQSVPDQKPDAVSAKILQQLLAGAKKKLILTEQPRDVVITIPASFDSDQCKATLDAAAEAGIFAYNQNGEPKDILLYEPKAVLYDIINSQINGEIPKSIMDISKPKNILVYDLGGGTLDVSLYKVSKDEKDELLNIEDMAISRYTQIGGDNFDYLIAEKLSNEFIEMYQDFFTVTEQSRKEIMSVFLKKAEQLKIDMNNDYEMLATRNQVLSDDHSVYMNDINVYGGYAFERDLTKQEMLEFIRPLMGEHLNINSVKYINRLQNDRDVNNIIYPILDVLAKAHDKYGEISVDYVILNGGMSKFFPVIERVKNFFGKEPITLNDPDMSVAKGAAIYHYYLHKYNIAAHIESIAPVKVNEKLPEAVTPQNDVEVKATAPGTLIATNKTTTAYNHVGQNFFNKRILNDTLNLEVRGGFMFPIAKAGTNLPFVSENLEILSLPKDGDCIRLPLYYGSGKKAEFPNRKIAERILTFPRTYAADTPISLQVSINQLNIISIRTWVTGKNEELGSVSMGVGDMARNQKATNKKKPVLANSSVGIDVDFHNQCAHLYNLCQRLQKIQKQGKKATAIRNDTTKQIREVVKRMKIALNGSEAGSEINNAIECFHQNPIFFSHILGVGAKLAPLWDDDNRQEFRKRCRALLEMVLANVPYYSIRDYHMQAINALTNINDPNDILLLENLLLLSDKSFPSCAAIALGKMQADPTLLIKQVMDLTLMDIQKLLSHTWAIGKLCSREMDIFNNMEMLQNVAEKCINLLDYKQIKNPSIINNLVYALGELCDTRDIVSNPLPNEIILKAKQKIETLRYNIIYTKLELQCINKINLALKMIKGEMLSETDNAQLLALREDMEK